MANSNRILVKLRPTVSLAAATTRANLRPLHDEQPAAPALGLSSEPMWYLADLPDRAGPTPWDLAHAQVADQLGLDESAVLFAEPDLPQSFVDASENGEQTTAFAAAPDCTARAQDSSHHKATGPDTFAWHLRDEFSQLGSARASVQFSAPFTRIAHIDTGYDPNHAARPENIATALERNFADAEDQPNSAQDPGRGSAFPDNSGHGTGTIGVLAGRSVGESNECLGGAPHAEIVPLRISNSVVLFHTSAFAQALQYAIQQQCDVVSISMGGLPSKAWNEAVNAAYESGMCIVAAAGNNVAGLPTHHVVYPARYHRTIAVCGVMADGRPYYDITPTAMQGNWGPESCMTAAIASYTPNIPWPVYHCASTIRQNGEGTSAATPQIAAAVALWFEKYKNLLPRDWRRVEAARHALFTSARNGDAQYFGRGILQAAAALAVAPVLSLEKTPPDKDSFSFLRVLTGLGITETTLREEMFNLELTQLYLADAKLQEIVPDPERPVSDGDKRRFMEAVIEDDKASLTLRKHLAQRYGALLGKPSPSAPPEVVPMPRRIAEAAIAISDPPFRRLRIYAVDPSFSTRLDTAALNEVVTKIRWEKLSPGPNGQYLKVIDEDSANVTHPPIDLDDPRLLAQDGTAPAEGNPAFHQQMVYAVAMKTIEHFERALGRPVLWRPRINPDNPYDDSGFVQQLVVRPHALSQANAYYSPQEIALLFGYFQASGSDPGDHVPGSMVYACLSHDIVAHEATHAILDGMHRRFIEPSNPDVLAFHEAFADVVALMQHFTIPEILHQAITGTRGNLESESILGSLAVQFGHAVGGRGALRDAIGKIDENGVWTRLKPDPAGYQKIFEPHARGALLVAAVFDAFLAIYQTRIADLLRIYTGGTGVLPSGAIHPDLVDRLSKEASKTAGHVLNMCIRALDYSPPVDITFGEYLRALITADSDLVSDDRYNYRVAFVEAFRGRGIYPRDLATLSVDTLRWRGLDISVSRSQYGSILAQLKRYSDKCFYISDRKALFDETRAHRDALHAALVKAFASNPGLASQLGLDTKAQPFKFEVHALRRSMRVGPDGQHIPQVIVALTQSSPMQVMHPDGTQQTRMFRGGSTLVVNLSKPAVQYAIVKRIDSETRQARTTAFLQEALADPLRALLLAPDLAEPFAALHSLVEVGH